MDISLNFVIFISFLILNLISGIFFSKNIKNITEYAVGERNFSTATITATIIATWIGSGFFYSAVSETYKEGLWHLIARFGDVLTLLIVGYVVAPRVGNFLGKVSVAQIMGDFYGKKIKFITAIASILLSIGYVAVQIKALMELFYYFFGVSNVYASLFATSVIVIYSTMGGIKAITFTDIIQFLTFGVFIPVFIIFLWNLFDNSPEAIITATKNNPLFSISSVFNLNDPKFYSFFILFLYYTIPGLDPATIQRILMAKDINQVRNSFSLAALFCFIIGTMACFIGIIMLVHNPNLNPDTLIEYVIDNYSYPGLKAFTLIGITAMIMSSADSYINSAAVIFAHDLIKPSKHTLNLSRIFSVFVGISATILALSKSSLYDLLLLAGNFYTPVITMPLLLAILGFRSTPRVVLTAIFIGISTVIIWRIFLQPITGIDSIIPGTIINLVTMLSMHYLLKEPGGWIKIVNNKDLNISESIYKKEFKSISHYFCKLLSRFVKLDLLIYSKSYTPKSSMIYVYAIFSAISTIIITLSINKITYQQNFCLINILLGTVLCIVTGLICQNLWPIDFKEKYLGLIWFISIFIASSCISSFLVLISNFTHISLVVLVLNLTMIGILIRWQDTLVMITLGLILSFLFYQKYAGIIQISTELYDLKLKIIYILFMISSILIAFFKPKQEYQDLTEEKNNHLNGRIKAQEKEIHKALILKNEFIRNINHEYHAPMTGIICTTEALINDYYSLDDYGRMKAIENIHESAIRLESFDGNIRDLAKLSSSEAELNITQIDLSSLVIQRLELCKKLYLKSSEKSNYQFITDLGDNITVEADEYYLKQTLDNLIINALTYCKQGDITLKLYSINDQVRFSITDQGVGIPKDEIYDIFGEFTTSSKTRTPAGGRGIGLAFCKKVLEAHKGDIWAISSGGETTFTFAIPMVFDDLAEPLSKEVISIIKRLIENGTDIKHIAKITNLKEIQIKHLEKK